MDKIVQLVAILDGIEPFTTKAVNLYRDARVAGQIKPTVGGRSKREMVEAIAEMARVSEQSSLMLERVLTLRPISSASTQDEDLFGC